MSGPMPLLLHCKCAQCRARIDFVSEADSDAKLPKAGDVSVCVYCIAMLRFVDSVEWPGELATVLITPKDFREMPFEVCRALRKAQIVVEQVNRLERAGVTLPLRGRKGTDN